MTRDRAAYMREYRKRQKAKRTDDVLNVLRDLDRLEPRSDTAAKFAAARISQLEEEVRHLKAELAKRPEPMTSADWLALRYDERPIRPVPKRSGR